MRSCLWEPGSSGVCDKSSPTCVPPVPAGFRVCVFHEGDKSCGEDALAPYNEKHLFYKNIHDARSCSACACGSPAGSVCSAEISIYTDDKCSSAMPNANPVDSNAPVCIDMIAGAALGSKSASPPTYAPGACQPSGGEPTGAAEPLDPATYCCIPSL